MDVSQTDAILLLCLTPGLGPTLIRRCIRALGSPGAVLDASGEQLTRVDGIGPKRSQEVCRARDRLRDGRALEAEKGLIEQHRVTVRTYLDPGYPRLLANTPDPPVVLYIRGDLEPDDALAVAVVGTRRCSSYGREQADRFSGWCAQAGLTIVSGGARGIDGTAHRAAMRVGGRTVAVLGSGLAQPYPADHTDLFNQIAGQGPEGETPGHGAVVSELPMNTPPRAENFPRRNRIISGLALGVLVIEAADRSGSLITARLAAEDHGREVMAVPGRVDTGRSDGCHKMIREGWAALVNRPVDVLDALGEAGQLLRAATATNPASLPLETPPSQALPSPREEPPVRLTDTQRRVFDVLHQPLGLDQVSAHTGLSVAVIQADLTMLQVRGLVQREAGLFARRRG